jgi:hypothetical protein
MAVDDHGGPEMAIDEMWSVCCVGVDRCMCTYTGSSESTSTELPAVLSCTCTRRLGGAFVSSDSSTVIPLSLMLTCRECGECLRNVGSVTLVTSRLSSSRTAVPSPAAVGPRDFCGQAVFASSSPSDPRGVRGSEKTGFGVASGLS